MTEQTAPHKLTPIDAVGIIEGFDGPATEEEQLEAWQYLVDTGLCWQLQGWYGRQARDLIAAGKIKKGA